ncbi:hypothetical protein P153DRAFT_357318 [Dothidotthia symphoricarpi CBS 119687]|uniref:Uncharacterized protein n=1 Tax=Dothidotthia symphoricarpi CBS 119687 TaxID=1392245 RepID=A0A6A6ACD8_9PLEO|nr:uncharacterized protein P153DRAFT_357318 [Dothidotthia symphoricarpi CBS 119687]KAF2128805.1 hypothetical protein P153DRAFT_357318 [Dothidotthia symphoricarpi CBS 119687]
MLPFDLKRSATTREAQAAAHHTKPQWARFYYQHITKAEIDILLEAQPLILWPSIPADVLTEIYNRVNAEIAKEQIPEVGYDIFSWRMARGIQNVTGKKRKMASAESAATAEPEVTKTT